MDRLALDTSFLIDLQNERRSRGPSRGAIDFLRAHAEAELWLPSVALGEYLEGFADPRGKQAQALVSVLRVIEVDEATAVLYAEVARSLRSRHRLIGTNDLWIGCTAKVADLPIATRNVEHFTRIPGLHVVDYCPG